MLVSLHVKNLALIDETEVFFGTGLNILTGETGAGKSIIIGSINLALGGKADKNLIRTGAEYALVELVFQTEKEEQQTFLKAMELPVEEDGTIMIQRKIMPQRSVSKVNGEAVSSHQLKELSALLINIHGQHEHQTLLNLEKQAGILDAYARAELNVVTAKIKEYYTKYRLAKKELDEATLDESARAREIALATFEADEIEKAGLRLCEDEDLEARYRKMINSRKIVESLSNAHTYTSTVEENSAGDCIGRALKELKTIAAVDESVEMYENQLIEIDNLLNDFNRSVAEYLTELEFDQDEYRLTEERLNEINHLKSKYGKTVEEILAYQEKLIQKLERYSDYESYINACQQTVSDTEKRGLEESKVASEIRKKYAAQLSKLLEKALKDLNFIDVKFEIQVRQKTSVFGPDGIDEIEFMISTNPGEPLKPLSSVASGGELSRIMLALKAVLADQEQTDTLIFDEIDAGISGKTAWKVSEKMAVLGKNHQLICITHLPQIAAMADSHYIIEKTTEESKTVTSIREIRDKELLQELARLLGGETITEAVLANAVELRELAAKTKGQE